MPSNSKAPGRGSREEFVLPNSYSQFKFLEVRIVGIDKAAIVNSLDILGWLVHDGRSVPITVFGVHEPKAGWHYAILNMEDKTHTELDGTQYADYKSFMAPKWEAYERGQGDAAPEVEPTAEEPREAAGPQAWKAVQR